MGDFFLPSYIKVYYGIRSFFLFSFLAMSTSSTYIFLVPSTIKFLTEIDVMNKDSTFNVMPICLPSEVILVVVLLGL